MKNLTFLFLMTLFILASCNEKVAEDLRDNTSSGSGSSGSTPNPITQFMRVVNKMDSDLSFVMHKTGTIDSDCILQPPAAGFKAEDYTRSDPIRNVDCILDVEELDLYFHGAEYEVQVENKMCEYVEYQPFRYFGMQPGTTIRQLYKVTCDDACSSAQQDLCGKIFTDSDGASVLSATSFTNDVSNDYDNRKLCRFNYMDNLVAPDGEYPNCDNGFLKAEAYKLRSYYIGCSDNTYTNQIDCEANSEVWHDQNYCGDPGKPAGVINITRETNDDERNECGGELTACLAGAGVEQIETREPKQVIEADVSKFRKEYTISAPVDNEVAHNRQIASFSRICADTSTNKTAPGTYDSLVYNGFENQRIASAFSSIYVDDNGDAVDDYIIKASHPFAGRIYAGFDGTRLSTSPYYAIRCLDRAGDVKAQIRMHIREWDREFEQNDLYLSRVSDLSGEASNLSKMDNSNVYDTDVPWNDYLDWDDFYRAHDTFTDVFVDNMCSLGGLNYDPLTDPDEGARNFPGIINR